ncbi:hypothetical protein [Psychromonas sp. MME2]|uniref:hypothetical protein n=1 Tax=unclassified Psychromonas TaxID=2614957 RepID=UPI00339CC807
MDLLTLARPFYYLAISTLLVSCNSSSKPNNNADNLDHIYTYQQPLPDEQVDPASCVNYSRTCTIAELPFIALSYPTPTINDIMSRVVVSHDWMGARFETLLTQLPPEIITLLGSVTAIVIADNIRPSFYWTGSAAIYIDPYDLWLSNEEKKTISQQGDYRSNYGENLSYYFFHRFIKDNQYAYTTIPLDSPSERTIDDIIFPMASLLFHELAHANDYMPQNLLPYIDIKQTTNTVINNLASQRVNILLANAYPLQNEELNAHAKIMYRGNKPNEQQQQDSAEYLGELMQQEGANHLYAYSTKAEDVAMLFQATMLKKIFDIDMDSAFVVKPEGANLTCADYLIAWGVRNRIADEITQPRALFVAQNILPNSDFSTFFDNLENPATFPVLTDWCSTNLNTMSKKSYQNKSAILIESHLHGITIY